MQALSAYPKQKPDWCFIERHRMTKNYSQVFEEICRKFEANDDAEALQELRDLASRVDDPWDKAWLNLPGK